MMRHARGFTLVELLVVLVLLGVVAPVLALSVSIVWKSTAAAMRSSTSSSERSLLTNYFTKDVAEATSVTLDPASPCGPLEGEALATFVSPEGSVSYVLAGVRPEYDGTVSDLLVRLDCTGSSHQVIVSAVKPGSTEFVCVSSAPTDPCRTVTLSVTHMDGATDLSALRRTT